MYVKQKHVPLAEHIVRSISYRQIYRIGEADISCAVRKTAPNRDISSQNFIYIGRGLRPLRRSRDMPSARYVSHDISALLIRYIPQMRNVKVNFRPGRKYSY